MIQQVTKHNKKGRKEGEKEKGRKKPKTQQTDVYWKRHRASLEREKDWIWEEGGSWKGGKEGRKSILGWVFQERVLEVWKKWDWRQLS